MWYLNTRKYVRPSLIYLLYFSTGDYGLRIFVYYEAVVFGIEFVLKDFSNRLKAP